ncbi:MAG TPA: hypothetical protein VE091_05815 [Gemmatimonadales bacterium]|nr:hypothetical protein [Gemmatimonadales bacterium]
MPGRHDWGGDNLWHAGIWPVVLAQRTRRRVRQVVARRVARSS